MIMTRCFWHICLAFVGILLPEIVQAQVDSTLYFEDFHIEATIGTDNKWQVTETVKVNFATPHHGIYLYRNEHFNLIRGDEDENGERHRRDYQFYCRLDDIEVEGWPFQISEDNDLTLIKIGDAERTIEGTQTYTLHYTYQYPDDRCRQRDYIYHTLLGPDYQVETRHFSFRIKTARPIPAEWQQALSVYSGEWGDTGNAANIRVRYEDGAICGEGFQLKPHQAVTLYQKLPEGFFADVEEASDSWMKGYFYATLALLVLTLFFALRIRHRHVTKQIEFYPPEGISSAEVGVIIDEQADQVDMVSLIPWMAYRGHLSIEELEKPKTLQLTRLKPLPADAPAYQQEFLHALFGDGDQIRLSDLKERHVKGLEKARMSLAKVFRGDRRLTRTSGYIALPLLLLPAMAAVVFCASPHEFAKGEALGLSIAFVLPVFLLMMLRLFLSASDLLRSATARFVEAVGGFLVLALFSLGALYLLAHHPTDSFLTPQMVVTLYLGSFIVVCLMGRFNVNTDYRVEMMGKLLGLREFIRTAEKERLRALVDDEPEYFFHILPYAQVFGITDKWVGLFKDIRVEQPSWYVSSHAYTTGILLNSLTTQMTQASANAISAVNAQSLTTSSSGGFAGGGGGGGGGGGW